MTTTDRRVVVVVDGRVQGVGFRWFVKREAGHLGLAGWAANRHDGAVDVVAQGPAPAVDTFIDALEAGPPGAAVRSVAVRDESPGPGLVGFVIRSGGHRGD